MIGIIMPQAKTWTKMTIDFYEENKKKMVRIIINHFNNNG